MQIDNISQKPKLIVIVGPTASGKTEMAVKLAKKFNGEVVSADSRQIYRGLDIGTAKITNSTQILHKLPHEFKPEYSSKNSCKNSSFIRAIFVKGIPHYMIDIINPDQEFTVAQYKRKAIKIIKDIIKRKKVPFLVGGTGLYIQVVVDNLNIPKVAPNKKLRKSLEQIAMSKGLKALYNKLLKLDPKAQNFIEPKNPRRIIRALEVCLITGKPFSSLRQKGRPLFQVLQIGIKLPQEKLNKKIVQRVNRMIKLGLVDEVRMLAKKYNLSLPSMSGIGYKEIGEYLKNKNVGTGRDLSLPQDTINLIKLHTHQFTKRQMTWFSAHGGSASGGKRDKIIKWVKNYEEAEKLINQFLKL